MRLFLLVLLCTSVLTSFVITPLTSVAQSSLTVQRATTTLSVSICGDLVVNDGEECDVPGETGDYSTTIAGRQCTAVCSFGPYCGDGILQTLFGEECDDGNNTDADFCAADCTIEVAGSGGGGSGGGGGSSGGSNTVLGDTQIDVEEEPARAFVFDPGIELQTLVDALNETGTTATDMVAILEALREAGALRAELIII